MDNYMQNVTGVTTNKPTSAEGATRTKGGLWNAGEYYHSPITSGTEGYVEPISSSSGIKTADYRHVSGTIPDGVIEYRPTPADGDDMTWDDDSLTYAALVRTVYRLQNEVAGLAAQVVELRERMEKWTADS